MGIVLSSYFAALIFYVVGRAMYGVRFGLLLALFMTALPDHWEFSAGFFSKFWAIPLILICAALLQSGRTRGFIALMPFAALAYPSVAVLIGMVAGIHWLLELLHDRARACACFATWRSGA